MGARWTGWLFLFSLLSLICDPPVIAGPYAPRAGAMGSTAIHMDDPSIKSWATGWEHYEVGAEVDEQWKTPEKALGKAVGTSFHIVTLGRGGRITMTFDPPIGNRDGYDFVVFENSFNDTFLELAYVEVSSDGVNFVRFPCDSTTADPVGGFGAVDPTNIDGLASKYKQGYGTPFDLEDVKGDELVSNGTVKVNHITHVRLIDIVGDGTCLDTSGDPIYDPYPTVGSAGFDLDAIGVINQGFDNLSPPDKPSLVSPADNDLNTSVTPVLEVGPFSDPDESYGDTHGQTRWQISTVAFGDSDPTEASLVLDTVSATHLTTLRIQSALLEPGKTYYWRVKFSDAGGKTSEWSDAFCFTTTPVTGDAGAPGGGDPNGIPDLQDLDSLLDDVDQNNRSDIQEMNDHFKVAKSVTEGTGRIGVRTSADVTIEHLETLDPTDLEDGESSAELMSLGLLAFRLKVKNPGDTVTVTIYLSEAAPSGYSWIKYEYGSGWRDYSSKVAFSADRRSLSLTLTDGGEGDADGLANGVIVDPGGVGRISSGDDDDNNGEGGGSQGGTDTSPPGSDGQAGFGGGGGCFISTIEGGE